MEGIGKCEEGVEGRGSLRGRKGGSRGKGGVQGFGVNSSLEANDTTLAIKDNYAYSMLVSEGHVV